MQIDLYPTLLELTGLSPDDSHILNGLSLAPILRGEAKGEAEIFNREAIFWHYPHYKAVTKPYSSVRKGDFKLIVYHEQELSPMGGKPAELFNLIEDPGEQMNLAETMPETRDALYNDIISHRHQMGAQMPEVNPFYRNRKNK
jgi:arylsulfatase A-like enzyme